MAEFPIFQMGVSENVVYPIVPNGFADHYPYEKCLFHWEYTLFSDKPIWTYKIAFLKCNEILTYNSMVLVVIKTLFSRG